VNSYTERGPIHYRYVLDASGQTMVTAYRCIFYVIKETPQGYWVVPSWCIPLPSEDGCKEHRRWVSKDSRKRYCYPSDREAWVSFQARQARRLGILREQLKEAEAAVKLETPQDSVRVEGRRPCFPF
jgi:hypothetical protein